jgi:hypothetical protein
MPNQPADVPGAHCTMPMPTPQWACQKFTASKKFEHPKQAVNGTVISTTCAQLPLFWLAKRRGVPVDSVAVPIEIR